MVANPCLESWQSLHQQLRGIAKRRAALDAEEARCLRDADAMQLWRRLGYVHMAEYLERELGYGPQAGAERLRVARELGGLPQTEAALADGRLSYSAVRELTRIVTADTEDDWLAEARGKNLRQIEAMVSGRKRGDRPSDPTRPDRIARVVRIALSPDVFALFRQAQTAMADEQGGRLDDNEFIEALCRRALGGDGSAARPAHQIAITVCESCKRGWQNGGGQEIEVAPEVVERAACDAEWIGSLEADQPARVTASVTPRMRRQVLARDHHRCTVPGCRSARNLDLHHIEYQCEGGTHAIWNLTTTCSGHHRQLHEGALAIRGEAPDALEFIWRDGVARPIDDRQAHESGETATAALHVGDPAVERPKMGDAKDSTDENDISGVALATGGCCASDDVRESRPAEQHRDRGSKTRASRTALGDTGSTADAGKPMTAKFYVEVPFEDSDIARALAMGGCSASDDVCEARTAAERRRDGASEKLTTRDPGADVHESTTDADRPGGRASGDPTFRAAPTNADGTAREPTTTTSHVGDQPRPDRITGTGAPAARAVASEPLLTTAVAASRAGDDALLRDAREALTTAGYKAHAARAAVEAARAELGDDVTLAMLIREALRCCARARVR